MKYIQTFDAINEAKKSAVHKAARKGSYPAVIVVVQDGKVIHQEPVSTPEVAPATFNVMQEKYPKALLHLEDNTGKRLFSESVSAAYNNLEKIFGTDQESMDMFQGIEDKGTVKDMIAFIDEFGNEEMLSRYGIKSTSQVKKLAEFIMGESVVTEAAYANASRNELAQYIINLSNELKAAKIAKDKKEIKYLEKDIAEVKAALDKKKNESVVTNEEYDGVISDFKYEFPIKFEEETGNNTKAIKKIAKKGKGYEVRTSTYMSQAEMEKVGLALGLKLKSYVKDSRVSISIYESVTEAAKIETERYVRSHGKKPKGYGGWMFSYNRDGSDEWQIPNGMSWPDAQKWAKKKAKEDGEDYVYVMENESVTEGEDTIGGLNKMANTDLERIADYADMIKDRMSQGQTLDAWMYSKISDSVKNLNSVHDTMDGNDGVNEAKDSFYIKQLTDTFDKFKLPRKYEIMMDSLFGGGSKIAVLRKRNTYGGGAMIDTHRKDGGSNYEGFIEILSSRSGRPIPGKSKFDNIDDAMKAATKFVDNIKESVVNEATDLNDPVLVAFRRTRAIMELPKFKPAEVKSRRISFDKYMIRLDLQADIAEDIKNKAEEMAQTLRDMEQEAEPEGGEIADEYGSIMMKQEKEYIQLKAKKAKIDAKIEKYRMS